MIVCLARLKTDLKSSSDMAALESFHFEYHDENRNSFAYEQKNYSNGLNSNSSFHLFEYVK